MLSYFRINDPYRLIIIFIALILFRLPFLISPNWFTIPELSWMIIGERMNEGALLYVGVWDDIGPLSALVYQLIDFTFGRSQLTFQIMGLLFFFFQVFYVNYIALRQKMFNENNYLPALFYGLLGLIFFNIITLSPQLLGMTFVLFSINHLFNHIETREKTDGNLLNIGLYVGIASLFYLPFFIIIIVHIASLVFFTNTIWRRYLLLVYGTVIPFVICILVYVWHGETSNLFGIFLNSLFHPKSLSFLSFKSIMILGSSTILVFVIASIKILSAFGYTVFQVRIQKVMFFSALVSLFIFTIYSDKDGYGLILFFPWVAFFISHFFIRIKNSLKRELGFLVYFLTIITIYIGITFQVFQFDNLVNLDALLIIENEVTAEYVDKKVLILGEDIKPYTLSRQATPYFNWQLSKDQLENLEFYDNLEAVNNNFRGDMPEYIIDQVGLAPKLFEQIPLIGREYEPMKNGIYRRITPHN